MFDASESTWFLGVEREREVLAVLDPEVAVEPALEVGRLVLELVREPGSFHTRRASRALRILASYAYPAARPSRGEAGQTAVAVRDRVPRVLPALVLEAGFLVPALVPDVAVVQQVGVLVDPVQRSAGLALELPDELAVARPALVLVEQHDVERRRVRAPVVRRVGRSSNAVISPYRIS